MLEREDNAYVISNLVMTLVELSELKYFWFLIYSFVKERRIYLL